MYCYAGPNTLSKTFNSENKFLGSLKCYQRHWTCIEKYRERLFLWILLILNTWQSLESFLSLQAMQSIKTLQARETCTYFHQLHGGIWILFKEKDREDKDKIMLPLFPGKPGKPGSPSFPGTPGKPFWPWLPGVPFCPSTPEKRRRRHSYIQHRVNFILPHQIKWDRCLTWISLYSWIARYSCFPFNSIITRCTPVSCVSF